jgi:NAD(P)-dependent dehydrogenase (short-subunit alcohol dehydrogenase family)
MLKVKPALITGSTQRPGLAIAQRLATAGTNIVLNGFGKVDEIKASQTAQGRAEPEPDRARARDPEEREYRLRGRLVT